MSRSGHAFWMRYVPGAAAACVGVAAPLTLLRFAGRLYPLELASHFQVQLCAISVAATLVLLATGRWWWAVGGLLTAVVTGSAIAPFALSSLSGAAYVASDDGGGRLRLMLANVLGSNHRYQQFLDLIEDSNPDVLVLQEVNASWMSALQGLRDSYPYMISGPREDNFGIAVFSRLPLAEAAVHTLGEAGLPSLSMRVDVGGAELTLIATHPTPPIPARRFHLRNDQLARLGELIDSSARPLVLVGDLNMTMWSPWYRRLTVTRRLFNSRRGFGVQGSWPACLPEFLRLPIDHCLLSEGLSAAGCSLGPDIGSDHLPLLVDLIVDRNSDQAARLFTAEAPRPQRNQMRDAEGGFGVTPAHSP